MPERQALTEARPLTEAATQPGELGRRQRILLINAGWGSSGFYGADVLREAAASKVFAAGTHLYINHPTQTEDAERPERDLRDLAGVLATDAIYDPHERGLFAVVETFPQYRQILAEMKDHIGLSIRAFGKAEHGEAEGREGTIITALTEAQSIDYVTRAGRGGRIVELLESARVQGGEYLRAAAEAKAPPFKKKDDDEDDDEDDTGKAGEKPADPENGEDGEDDDKPPFLKGKVKEARNVGHWLESRIHAMFTQLADDMFGEGRLTRDERISLSSAIGEGLTAFNAVVAEKVPHLYERDLWDNPEPPAPTGMTEQAPTDAAPVEAAESEPGSSPAEMTEREVGMPELTEEQVAQLAEAAATKTRLEEALSKLEEATGQIADLKKRADDADARADAADQEKRKLANDKTAREKVTEALKTAGLPAAAHARVAEAVCRDLPVGEDGTLDEVKLGESITSAVEAETTYLAAVAEASGLGMVRGLGESTTKTGDADIEKELAEAFRGIGLDDKAALTAAAGRG